MSISCRPGRCWCLIPISLKNWHQCCIYPIDTFQSRCFCGNNREVVAIVIEFDVCDKWLNAEKFSNRDSAFGVRGFIKEVAIKFT